MKELIERLKTETPVFFKRIILFGCSLLILGTGIVAAPEGVREHLPEWLNRVAGYLITIGFVSSLIAKFAKVDQPK